VDAGNLAYSLHAR